METDTGSDWVAEFHGNVHPQGWGWGLDEPIKLTSDDSEWFILLEHSALRVVVGARRLSDLPTFVNEVMSTVRGVLDSLGFHLGAVLTPELTGGFTSPGVPLKPRVRWDDLTGHELSSPLRVDAEMLLPFIRTSVAEPWFVSPSPTLLRVWSARTTRCSTRSSG